MPKAAKKNGKPKRAPTAFILWSNDNREAVKKENSNISFGEVGKVLGDKWKTVSADEKQRYEQKSAELKVQWQKDMAAWTAEHGDEESDSGKKGKAKGKRGKKEAGAPKGATNAYMMFSKEQREKLKAEGKKVSFGDAGKLISERWKALSEDDKKPYQEAADKDKKRHEKELEEFKKKGGKTEKPAAAKKAAKKEESSSDAASSSEEEKSESEEEASDSE